MRLLLICLAFVVAAGAAGCGGGLSASAPPQQGASRAAPVTDYASLLARLRAAGASIEPGGEVEQPFFSVKGKMVEVYGEDVQVFEYSDAAAAEAQAAQVSPTGTGVGTTKIHWIAPPHFYKKGRLLVLYVGDNDKVLKALDAALGPQFAGARP